MSNLFLTRDSVGRNIQQIKQLKQSEIKNIGLEDRSVINKIIDFYNSKEEKLTIKYFGFSENPICNIADNGTWTFDLDHSYSQEPPPPSNSFVSFFKGLFNLFGRVGSGQLHNKIRSLGTNGSMGAYYDDI
jgi:hypothetical protein